MGVFHFKQFDIDDTRCGMKVGTDGVLLGCWADLDGAATVVDAGCGSGLITVMAAQRLPEARIIGIDVSHAACLDARMNADRSPWGDRIEIVELDLAVSPIPAVEHHPLHIISNPPFFCETLRSPGADRALARHGEGFDVMPLIARAAEAMTLASDALSFIAPWGRLEEIEFQLALHRLAPSRICAVSTRDGRQPSRVLCQAVPLTGVAHPVERTVLALRDSDNTPSPAYRALTSHFYLDLK